MLKMSFEKLIYCVAVLKNWTNRSLESCVVCTKCGEIENYPSFLIYSKKCIFLNNNQIQNSVLANSAEIYFDNL